MKIMKYEWQYDDLNEAYSSKSEFIYFLDPDLDIQTKTDFPFIRIGFFDKRKVILINNMTLYFNFLLTITFFIILLLML